MIVLWLVIWTVLGIVVMNMAENKGRTNRVGWFIYGFFLGLIALVHAACMSPVAKCPLCMAGARKGATKCRECGGDL